MAQEDSLYKDIYKASLIPKGASIGFIPLGNVSFQEIQDLGQTFGTPFLVNMVLGVFTDKYNLEKSYSKQNAQNNLYSSIMLKIPPSELYAKIDLEKVYLVDFSDNDKVPRWAMKKWQTQINPLKRDSITLGANLLFQEFRD